MQVTELIGHPELLNRDTLYELRRVVGQCPYYQAARLLLIENLFLLHDPDFDAELRTAALFVPDRRVLFDLVESLNYEPVLTKGDSAPVQSEKSSGRNTESRTLDLIGQFLQKTENTSADGGRRPRTIDPISDYVSLLEDLDDVESEGETENANDPVSTYLTTHKEGDRITLPDAEISTSETENAEKMADEPEVQENIREEYFTETLAKVFIKQGNFERAIEILTKINLENPRKNAYFADQIRFLQKTILAQGGKKNS